MPFDAGAIAFKFLTAGKAQFVRDQADAEAATKKTAKASTEAATATDKAGTAAEKAAKTQKQLAAEAKRAAEEQKKAAEELGRGLMIAGAAFSTMVGISVAAQARFDQAMSQTSAALMATTQQQKDLREAALQAGADSAYSATEAANAQEELGKAGLETAEIVGGALNGALALAAAGQVELARSAEIMATTLKQYNLEANQAGHVSDLLAAGAGKAQGSVEDLSLALGYAGPVAAGLGISLEETTGVLGLFASNGILADRAGTGLRGMLMSLTSPSAIAARTMEEYGVAVFNADGSMKSLAEVAQELQGAFGHLTEQERSNALGRIFGNEQITTARILYEGGADAVEKWTKQVDDAGYAERQAAMRTDNLLGDLERLGGAFETVLIKGGTGANDTLRGLVQTVEGAVDWFGELPDPVEQTALGLGVALGAAALFAGGALTLRTRLAEMRDALNMTNAGLRRTAVLGGAVGLALTGIAYVVGNLALAHQQAQQKAKDYATTLEEGTQAITDSTRAMVVENLKAEGAFEWAEKLGLDIGTATKAALGNKDAQAELNAELERYAKNTSVILDEHGPAVQGDQDRAVAAQKLRDAINGENDAIARGVKEAEQMEEATAAATEETEGAAAASETAAGAYLAEAGALEDLNRELDDLISKLLEANGQNRDAVTANSDYQQSLDDLWQHVQNVKDGVEGYGAGLDTTTQAGRDNMAMLTQLAEDAERAAEAQLALDGDTEKFIGTLSSSRDELARAAQEMGLSEEAAKALADQILAIPDQKEIDILAETTFAQQQIDTYISENTGREIILKIGTSRVAQGAGGAGGITFADGAVVSYHANGSMSPENHVAQLADAGDWRVWAEPETGGEAYIPLTPAKRARSEVILEEVARRFGGTVTYHAEGSAPGSATSPTSPIVNFTGDFILSGMTPPEVRAVFREELNRLLGRGGLR